MAESNAVEQARARATAAAITALVDVQDWKGLMRHFAPRVIVDYSSLFPGEPENLSADELIERWRALLPGFDATRHILSEVNIAVEGDDATGEARVVATHYLGGQTWVPAGRYRYCFRRIAGHWRISALTFVKEHEDGDRELPKRAAERASRLSK